MTRSGVGYVVLCPVPLEVGQEVDLVVTTVVREDAITLYGFKDPHEQLLFESLTKVSGVGASIAMAVLSDVGVGPAVRALVDKDAKTLAKAKGLGVKRAETLCTAVRLPESLLSVSSTDKVPPAALGLTSTLVAMGFDEREALDAARAGVTQSGGDLGGALRVALGILRGQGEVN